MTIVRKLIVSGLGTGYLRPAPGTWGSIASCGAWLGAWVIVRNFLSGSELWIATSCAAVAIVILSAWACIALGEFTEKAFGRKDPSQCTIDEWSGQALTLVCLPIGCGDWRSVLIVAGVALAGFRFFDILKPPPIHRLERLQFGWGVVADDLMAGVYANIICQLVLRFGFQL